MRKILFITTNDQTPWGGSEVLWYETALLFLKEKYAVGISIRDWLPIPKHINRLIAEGATIIERKTPKGNRTIIERVANKLFAKEPHSTYHKMLLAFKPSLIVICQGGNQDGLHWMEFCKNHQIPFMTIVQAATESWWPDTDKIEALRTGYKSALKCFFVSKANLNLTEIQIGSRLPLGKVINNPFNVNYHNNLHYPPLNGNYNLANVARHELQAKGQDVLFEVLSDPKWSNRSLTVSLYGSGIHTSHIKDLLNFFNLKNVIVKGYQDTTSIWQENHGLVLPSRFEGLPLALVEAMLCNRFGIVTDVSGNKEVIVDNVNGFVAAAPKAEYLDEAMERAWTRREEWMEIGLEAGTYIKTLVPENPINNFYNEILNAMP